MADAGQIDYDNRCVVCRQDFNDGLDEGFWPEPKVRLVCGHNIGLGCGYDWLIRRGKGDCPKCRKQVTPRRKPMPALVSPVADEGQLEQPPQPNRGLPRPALVFVMLTATAMCGWMVAMTIAVRIESKKVREIVWWIATGLVLLSDLASVGSSFHQALDPTKSRAENARVLWKLTAEEVEDFGRDIVQDLRYMGQKLRSWVMSRNLKFWLVALRWSQRH